MGRLRTFTGSFELRRMPWPLLLAALVAALVGVLFIRSAASAAYAQRQLMFLAVAVTAFLVAAFMDYRHLANLSGLLYVAALFALGLLPVLGLQINNARRWYDVGPVNVQPSEPAKYIVIIALATYFTCRERWDRLRDLTIPLVITLVVMGLVFIEPDLGSSLLFLPTFFAIAFMAGVPVRNLVLIIAAGLILAVAAWHTPGALKPYQKARVMSFVDPEYDPSSPASYNARQATLAVTGGGAQGQGWGRGLLTQLGRIPERHTDFIFPVIAEEWGFVRTAPLMLLYLGMVILMARITWQARDAFGRLLAGGITTIFGVQTLLHMAIAMRLAPITGLTLPLISYGGSSLVSTFLGLGVMASVAMRSYVGFPEVHKGI